MSDYAKRRRMMVDTQVRPADVTKFPIIDAMLTVPREAFVPRDRMEAAYMSENIAIGGNRVILEPRTFAKMLDALALGNDDLVLDLGAGLGYSSAVIAHIAEAVVAVEDDEARLSEAESLLAEHHADNVILHGGALSEGAPEHGPYDAILIEGAVEEVPEVMECYLMSGEADYLIRVLVRDANDYERVHREVLSGLPGVARLHSSFTIRRVFSRTTMPVPDTVDVVEGV